MEKHIKLLAIGDATKDVFVEIEEATVTCTIEKETCLFCLSFADKIPVKRVTEVRAAGNAANAAVGTRRLGHTCTLLTFLGADDDGEDIAHALKKEKVDTTHICFDKKNGTNYSTILNFKGERTILVKHRPRDYKFPRHHPEAAWVYYTSLGAGHEKYEKSILAYLHQRPKTKLLFNPGTHQLRRGLKSLLPVIKRTSVLIINKQEARLLLMSREPEPIPTLLRKLHQYGSEIIVITDGPKGSWAYNGEEMWKLRIFPGKAKERTGAGDAYATGFLNALMSGKHIQEAMRWGNANAWSVIQYIGPQEGLLKKTSMQSVLKKFSKIKARHVNHQR